MAPLPDKDNIHTFMTRSQIYQILINKKLVLSSTSVKVADVKAQMEAVARYVQSVRQFIEPEIIRDIVKLNNKLSNLASLMANSSVTKEQRNQVKAEIIQDLSELRDRKLLEKVTNLKDTFQIVAYDADPLPGAGSLKPADRTYMSNMERRNLDRTNTIMQQMNKYADKVPKHIDPKIGFAPFICPLLVTTKPAMDDDKMKVAGPDFKFHNMYHFGYIWMDQLLIGIPREIATDKDEFASTRIDIVNKIRKINKQNYVDMTLNDAYLTVRGSPLAFFWLMRKNHYVSLHTHTNFKIDKVSLPFDVNLAKSDASVESLRSLRQNLEKEITDATKDNKAALSKAKIELKEVQRDIKEISDMKMYKYINEYTQVKDKKKVKITPEEIEIAKKLVGLRKRRRELNSQIVNLTNEIDKTTEEVTKRVRKANELLGSNFDPGILVNPTIRKLLFNK